MSAGDHLSPGQFGGDELAARRKQKFNTILDQVPSFDDEINADAAKLKAEYQRLESGRVAARRASIKRVK